MISNLLLEFAMNSVNRPRADSEMIYDLEMRAGLTERTKNISLSLFLQKSLI